MLALIGISNLVVIYFGVCVLRYNQNGTIAEFIVRKYAYLACSLIRLGIIHGSKAEASQKRLNEFQKLNQK
jgi:hypothetical protein